MVILDINVFCLNIKYGVLKQYCDLWLFFFKKNKRLWIAIIYKLSKKSEVFLIAIIEEFLIIMLKNQISFIKLIILEYSNINDNIFLF